MHAVHTLAHRAPPATRTRVRWQPYSAISSSSSSSSSRSSPLSYLNTPSSSVSSSPHISNKPDPLKPSLTGKDSLKNKYLATLVDQAVKSLAEIWRPQDIPSVFMAPMAIGGGPCEPTLVIDPKPLPRNLYRNTQLPSPISPSTRAEPISAPSSPVFSLSEDSTLSALRGNLVPLKSFVTEVLRRSRTSGCVLQTALCYLEAIRSKVPELVRAEQAGEGVRGELDQSDWIMPATPEDLEREAELSSASNEATDPNSLISADVVATIRVDDDAGLDGFYPKKSSSELPTAHQRLPPAARLPPLPPLPSPLLCPRRAFLASLILASKFTQDKCYSNRAWAKLSGLPPREIGRCERALGEALEWRLWVGKQPSAAPPSPPLAAAVQRPLVRTQSESVLNVVNSTPFLVAEDSASVTSPMRRMDSGLRRHRTLPPTAFSAACPPPLRAVLDYAPWRTSADLASSALDTQGDLTASTSSQLTGTESMLMDTVSDLDPPYSAHYTQPFVVKIGQSASPPTPNLTYSPSSTESSSGDRTIQMSSFLDDTNGSFHLSQTTGSESWPWLDVSDGAIAHPSKGLLKPLEVSFDATPTVDLGVALKMTDKDCGALVVESSAAVYPVRW
ncbi:hypothetical protein H0H92_008780 [Tricholoma furcatifolium]|nr:hypothetical protein H0H92_008780 [Tricholoma furcatifolium]